ncbi:MAG TPA: hypothetical protein DD400_01970 [Rhodospirillaceae bacterium]|nr:hypothetical protein [Rhodospirillaceae bacterium]
MQEAVKEQMNKMTNNLVQSATEMNSVLHDTMSASLQSVSVMIKGYSDLCDSFSLLTQKTLEQSTLVNQTMMSVSSVDDLVSTQNSLIKNNFDNMMSEMNNITELSSRIAQQASEPVTKHMNDTLSKISKTQAA